jgi:uncharacterized protein YicC (UPF0701 family)
MLLKSSIANLKQAEAIGTTASIIALVGTTFTLIQQVRNARDRVRGASKVLENISRQLESLEQSLALVREEEGLQTAGVEQQVRAITEVVEDLRSFLDALAAEQQKKTISQLIRALKSGDKDDKQLEAILNRLDRGRDELVLRVSVAQVGVVGTLKDGFRIAFGVLLETNMKVDKVLGTNLILAERLKDRSFQQTSTET